MACLNLLKKYRKEFFENLQQRIFLTWFLGFHLLELFLIPNYFSHTKVYVTWLNSINETNLNEFELGQCRENISTLGINFWTELYIADNRTA